MSRLKLITFQPVSFRKKFGTRDNVHYLLKEFGFVPEVSTSNSQVVTSYESLSIEEQARQHHDDRIETIFNLAIVTKLTAEKLKENSSAPNILLNITGNPPQSNAGTNGTVGAHRSPGQICMNGRRLQDHYLPQNLGLDLVYIAVLSKLGAVNIVDELVNKVDSSTERNKYGGLVHIIHDILQKLCLKKGDPFDHRTYDLLEELHPKLKDNLEIVRERFEKDFKNTSASDETKKEAENKIEIIEQYEESLDESFEQSEAHINNAINGTEMLVEESSRNAETND